MVTYQEKMTGVDMIDQKAGTGKRFQEEHQNGQMVRGGYLGSSRFHNNQSGYCVEYEGKGDSGINESTNPNTVPSLPDS